MLKDVITLVTMLYDKSTQTQVLAEPHLLFLMSSKEG